MHWCLLNASSEYVVEVNPLSYVPYNFSRVIPESLTTLTIIGICPKLGVLNNYHNMI